MSDLNQYDPLGALFRQKLQNHLIPVEPDWDAVERRLNHSRRKVLMWWLSGTAAAAAVIALVLFLRPATEKMIPPITVIAQQADTVKIENGVISRPAQQAMSVKSTKFSIQPEPLVHEEPFTQEQPESTEELETTAIQQQEKETPVASLWIENDAPLEKTVSSKEKKWTIAASARTSGGRSEDMRNINVRAPSASFVSIADKSDGNRYASTMALSIQPFDQMTKNDFNSIRHLPPLSLGVTARKNMGRTDLEVGFVYTYLASQFSWTALGANYKAHQSLHYIGIPVNVVGYLWNARPNWKLYVTVGIMGEKGVRAIFKQEMRTTERFVSTTVKKGSINGLQWSLNGGLGVSYQIKNNLNLYFEPRTGYNFDCKQPISMRTEWPFYIGFGMGINFKL
ncbi:MAG: PorT family protein [Bacteroidetes bacterium]|nr:PorT family protein [Bacteroidota bacterium]